jgi:hypothetical protein
MPAFAPPKIEIRIGPPTDKIDTTKSLEQVRAAAAEVPHTSRSLVRNLGALQFGIQIDDSVRKIGAGRFCAAPKICETQALTGPDHIHPARVYR